MTETSAPETAPPAPEPPEPPATEAPEDGAAAASREAASYRRRLREAERERDGLRERLATYERTEAERIAAERGLGLPSDLWVAVQMDDLRAEDGGLDHEKVKASVDGLLKARPHWRKPIPDLGSGARTSSEPRPPGLGALLKGQR